MKVYVLPADEHGCGYYRLIWPANVLFQQGFNVQILPPSAKSGFEAATVRTSDGREVLARVKIPEDADVIVLQRPAHPFQPDLIDILRANGVAVVVDMDDDMSAIHPNNAAWHMYRPRSGSAFSWKFAAESCKRATLVTTSTAELQKVYARHGRGVTIDNYVPKAYLDYPKVETGAFGWAGTMKSHPNDPQLTSSAVRRLQADGHEFRVVGDGKGIRAALRLDEEPPATGMVKLLDWARVIGETMDVGLVPLDATAFNTSKSRLKGIESSAVGVPWVASPRAEYRRLVKESQAGLLADSPKDWYHQVKRLLTDRALREDLIAAGKSYMADQTYEKQAHRWADAWTRAFKIQRGVS